MPADQLYSRPQTAMRRIYMCLYMGNQNNILDIGKYMEIVIKNEKKEINNDDGMPMIETMK